MAGCVPPRATGSYADLQTVTATSANDVWAAGADIARTNDPMVLHFDGTAWSVQSPLRRGEYVYVSGIGAMSSTDAWFAGWWADQTTNPLVEHWNGTSWTFTPMKTDFTPVRVVPVSANDAWISGYRGSYHAATKHWDGTSWTLVQGASIGTIDSELYARGLVPDAGLWASGEFEPTGVVQPLIEFNATP